MWEVEVHKIEPGLAGLGLPLEISRSFQFVSSHLFLLNLPHLHWALAKIPGGEPNVESSTAFSSLDSSVHYCTPHCTARKVSCCLVRQMAHNSILAQSRLRPSDWLHDRNAGPS